MKLRYIYHIADTNGVVRYIGCSNNPYARFIQHLKRAEGYVPCDCGDCDLRRWEEKYIWMQSEILSGRFPILHIVRIAKLNWRADERSEMHSVVAEGHPILNLSESGRWMIDEIVSLAAV